MGTPRFRRAIETDAPAIAALMPGLAPSATDEYRATFVLETNEGLRGVIELVQKPDHFVLLHLAAATPQYEENLGDFAEHIARTLKVRDIRLAPDALTAEAAARLGFRGGVRRVRHGRFEKMGVPVWRDGTASLFQTIYFRGVWAALSLLFGLGSISVAVFSGGALTLGHVVLPMAACAVGTLFAVWQMGLIVRASWRGESRTAFAGTVIVAAFVCALAGMAIQERAIPSLTELWNIYSGDVELSNLSVQLSSDGRTLEVRGSYGAHSEEAVRRALAANPSIREVVLSGPGGRVATGIELFRLFRDRKLATRVDRGCASACTIAFLGGVQRSISPPGKLGFHRASFPGMGDDDMYDANRGLRNFMIYSARVTPDFAQRVLETPASEIWVPTIEELLAGKVIDRVNR